MIFARDITGPLTSLVKKIDAATAKNSGCNMGSFIVFLGADENTEKKLKDLAEEQKLEHTVVTTMDNPSGPPAYKIAKGADVTVVLYTHQKVKANYAYAKGKLTDEDVDKIVGDLKKITDDK